MLFRSAIGGGGVDLCGVGGVVVVSSAREPRTEEMTAVASMGVFVLFLSLVPTSIVIENSITDR